VSSPADRLHRLVPPELAEQLLAPADLVAHERRLVTILFSDVKGSTALAGTMDPEEWLEIMDGAFDHLIEPVYRYEGTVARLMGDAILAFFGAPTAHEDDAQRACLAALEIISQAEAYGARLKRERGISGFHVRVGIHTGLVVVGEVGSDRRVEYTAMGDAANLAARLESAAQPGTVLISEDTQRLVAELAETEPLPPLQLKGKTTPVQGFRLLSASAHAGRPRGIEGMSSPLVGRAQEFQSLKQAIASLEAGLGGIVTVVGEAGLGKSRLVAEARLQASAQLQWFEGRCVSFGGSAAYSLWVELLRSVMGLATETSTASARDVVHQRVDSLCSAYPQDVYGYLARLLSLPLERGDQDLSTIEGEQLKTGTFAAVETLIQCAALERPLVLVCEDLHWADPTSLELLLRVMSVTDRAPLLLLCVYRPETDHGCWRIGEVAARQYPHRHLDLRLTSLGPADSETLVGNLLKTEAVPEPLRSRLLASAEGNPFYVEELLRSLVNQGVIVHQRRAHAAPAGGEQWLVMRDSAAFPIPDTLQAVLMARIDRLSREPKRVLQIASVIGRIFALPLLVGVLPPALAEPGSLRQSLQSVQREQLIRQRAQFPEPEYIFKHELTREASYHTLLRRDRRALHQQVAEKQEQLLADRVDQHLGLLAYHWERAGHAVKAVDYLLRAGRQASRSFANEEALDAYGRALGLLEQPVAEDIPASWRWNARAGAHEGCGDILGLTGLHGEARAAFRRALAVLPPDQRVRRARLQRRIATAWDDEGSHGQAAEAYRVAEEILGAEPSEECVDWWQEWLELQHRSMWRYYGLGRTHEMEELAEKMRPVVEKHGTAAQRGAFHQGLGLLGLRQDRYLPRQSTVDHVRASLAAFRETGNLATVALAQSGLGFALLWRGHLDEAETEMLAGLALAERIGDFAIQSRNLIYLAILYRRRGDVRRAKEVALSALDLISDRQMWEYMGLARANLGWVALREGDRAAAVAQAQDSLALWRKAPQTSPFQWTALWLLIDAELAQGNISEAAKHARQLVDESQQRLPADLAAQVKLALTASEADEVKSAVEHLQRAVRLALSQGYL
jgi:class 3 adenylate cyclase/tetratricopeptide (TPR) repeat protein